MTSSIPTQPLLPQQPAPVSTMSDAKAEAVFREAIGLEAEAPAATEAPVITPPPIAPLVTRRRRQPAPVLPPVEQEAIELPRAEKAYKVPFTFSEASGWSMSADGGKTSEPTGAVSVSGAPIDISLAITPATWQKGAFDWRLSLEFVDTDGCHCELNLNALRPSKEDPGELVLTGPARALLGSLLAITDDDNAQVESHIASFITGARFTLKRGSAARSQFIEVAVCQLDPDNGALEWLTFSSPKYTASVTNTPNGLIRAVERVKQAFRQRNHFSPNPAVTGKENLPAPEQDDFNVVPIEATVIND
jgi:hypothetical protein